MPTLYREADSIGGGGGPFTAATARKLTDAAREEEARKDLARLPQILKRIETLAREGKHELIYYELLPKALVAALKADPYKFTVFTEAQRDQFDSSSTTISW